MVREYDNLQALGVLQLLINDYLVNRAQWALLLKNHRVPDEKGHVADGDNGLVHFWLACNCLATPESPELECDRALAFLAHIITIRNCRTTDVEFRDGAIIILMTEAFRLLCRHDAARTAERWRRFLAICTTEKTLSRKCLDDSTKKLSPAQACWFATNMADFGPGSSHACIDFGLQVTVSRLCLRTLMRSTDDSLRGIKFMGILRGPVLFRIPQLDHRLMQTMPSQEMFDDACAKACDRIMGFGNRFYALAEELLQQAPYVTHIDESRKARDKDDWRFFHLRRIECDIDGGKIIRIVLLANHRHMSNWNMLNEDKQQGFIDAAVTVCRNLATMLEKHGFSPADIRLLIISHFAPPGATSEEMRPLEEWRHEIPIVAASATAEAV